MAQLNIYVPDHMAADLKDRAKASGKSLSTYVTEIIQAQAPKTKFDWDAHFAAMDALGPCDMKYLTDADRHFGEIPEIKLD